VVVVLVVVVVVVVIVVVVVADASSVGYPRERPSSTTSVGTAASAVI
jgi:hypothetical protein